MPLRALVATRKIITKIPSPKLPLVLKSALYNGYQLQEIAVKMYRCIANAPPIQNMEKLKQMALFICNFEGSLFMACAGNSAKKLHPFVKTGSSRLLLLRLEAACCSKRVFLAFKAKKQRQQRRPLASAAQNQQSALSYYYTIRCKQPHPTLHSAAEFWREKAGVQMLSIKYSYQCITT